MVVTSRCFAFRALIKHFFCKTKTDFAYKLRVQDLATGKNFSFNRCFKQGSFGFFSRESYFIKAIENFFPVFAYPDINTRGLGKFSTVMHPSTSPRVCITVSNSPNQSCVYIRLCKHGKRFILLKYVRTFGTRGSGRKNCWKDRSSLQYLKKDNWRTASIIAQFP